MRVSWAWLSDWIDLSGVTPEELAERLTAAGVAVEAVHRRNPGVAGVVVGRVVDVRPHPEADRLKIAVVETAAGGPTRVVVTGAPNVAVGGRYPYATVGARLPGGVEIRPQAFRGVTSEGMLCSAEELGLETPLLPPEAREGLYRLPDEAPLGADVVSLLGLDDVVLELDLTPNRADCLSIVGVAREVAALLDRPLRATEVERAPEPGEGGSPSPTTGAAFSVAVLDPALAPLYLGQVVDGLSVRPSPLWLQNRLLAAGIRPINTVVDVTNYVMLEYGQPLHAFDADRVGTGRIVVRRATAGETLVTLDGRERALSPDDLVITDGARPIGLAGVMGGENTEVVPSTRRVFLESALFDGTAIRRTAIRFDLRSEASRRFEKGVDPERVELALRRATALLGRLAGGRPVGGIVGVRDEAALRRYRPRTVRLSLERLNRHLGTALDRAAVEDVFRRLQFSTAVEEGPAGPVFRVTVPTRRMDVALQEDLIEEVARLIGYDRIPSTVPHLSETVGGRTSRREAERAIARLLQGLGLSEARTYVLVDGETVRRFPIFDAEDGRVGAGVGASGGGETGAGGQRSGAEALAVLQPMHEGRTHLRRSLLPGLLEVAAHNRRHQVESGRFFEIGKVFHPRGSGALPAEPVHVAALWFGLRPKAVASGSAVAGRGGAYDFYAAKGAVEAILERFGIAARFVPAALPGLHPGRTARIEADGAVLGWVGELHPAAAKAYELSRPVAFELSLDRLLARRRPAIAYGAPPRYPGVRRDVSFWIDRAVPHEAVLETIRRAAAGGPAPLEEAALFDVYEGPGAPEGRRSLAYALVFRHPERTLAEADVDESVRAIVAAVEAAHGARLRGEGPEQGKA
ncbi:phenylalanine--tRNA ligase subunit beta [Hydrogenibacillus schlegelii]|uniref:Phenylalanine--tRNA ligase beta subunit n=1 Tax=Hydrogenibacillus schlegelii TaxID=1484 RepID=A0A132MGS4_HYDSH|nr:phenylalanine--tRNA ligase subunit beta [Hydrogenibacillus schlegelii]KWW97037.1 hypothetical protein TR75_10695 [Hydrogenibacillus schlegelii]OAR04499.1 hypothetical protein SA87_10430 [Hydrogenibacillus schlegelii]